MNNTICKNCGGDEGLHHYQTNQCPVGGREAPFGRKQEWKSTTFEPDKKDDIAELRETVNKLIARIEHLETDLAAREYREELAESVKIWDAA